MDGKATAWERLTRVDVRIWDGLLAVLAVANAQLDLWYATDPRAAREPDLLAATLLLVATAPLFLRRNRPFATAVVVSAAVVAFGWLYHPSTEVIFSLVLAAYSIASYMPRSSGQTLGLIALAVASGVSQSSGHANWVELASNAMFTVGVPFAIGRIVWNRRRRLERERDQAARDAVALERSRIARELHDVVAHAMSVMVVQAGAARAVLRRDPDQTERALTSIEESGRTGLAEMRRLLSADGDGAPSLAPQPGLGQLDELLERMRATGLDVELVTEGDARPLEAGVDLSLYRIVQEALTNALRHGGDDVHARVLLRYRVDGMGVEISDDGRGPAPETDVSGRGLVGMRERVAFLGGTITTGARPGGGFLVQVLIPVAGDGHRQP